MENVIDLTSGAVSEKPSDKSDKPREIDAEVVIADDKEPTAERVYSAGRGLRRGGAKALMAAAAAFGAAAGAVAVLTGACGKEAGALVSERLKSGFGSVFLSRALISEGAVLAEFLLGFFAFGDLVVWVIPLFLGLGAGLAFSAYAAPALLPSYAGVIFCGSVGAAFSCEFSAMLRGFAGGRNVRTGETPAARFAGKFALIFGGMLAAAAYEGIIAQFAL